MAQSGKQSLLTALTHLSAASMALQGCVFVASGVFILTVIVQKHLKKISHDLATQTTTGDWGWGVIISSNPFLHLMHSDLVPSWVRALKSQQAGLVAEKIKVTVERCVFTAQFAVFAATQTSCPIFSGCGIFNEAIMRITVLLPSPLMENYFNLS